MTGPRNVLIAGYDGTSRVKGVESGARALWQALQSGSTSRHSDWLPLELEGIQNSNAWCRAVHDIATGSPISLALGGEHLLTFPLVEVMVKKHPGLRLVVLDAHHDAYDYPLLTHYSLFHYCHHELGVPTLIVGARHELARMPPGCVVLSDEDCRRDIPATLRSIQQFVGESPCYFSVDVDVLDPTEFPAVSDAIPGGLSVEQLVNISRVVFALAPIAADIVEYNPTRDPAGAFLARLQPFLAEVGQWLS